MPVLERCTRLSHLTDEEFVRHLLNKEEVTDEDIEGAQRLDTLLSDYRDLLENVHTLCGQASTADDHRRVIAHLSEMSAPVPQRDPVHTMQ